MPTSRDLLPPDPEWAPPVPDIYRGGPDTIRVATPDGASPASTVAMDGGRVARPSDEPPAPPERVYRGPGA